MIRRPPRSTLDRSSAASDVYKRQEYIYVSSTAAREIARYGGKVTAYVDERIADMVSERGKQYSPKQL